MHRSQASRSESGSSAIEFALVTPVLLILALGMVDGWSLIAFTMNMRAGVGSAADLYLQGAGADDLVEQTAIQTWQDRPADAVISTERTYLCGTQIVGEDDDVCPDGTAPAIEVLVSASGTWTAPFHVDFLGTSQVVRHEQTVRIR